MASHLVVQGHFLHHPYSGIGVFLEEMLRQWQKNSALTIHILCWYQHEEQKSVIEKRFADLAVTFSWTRFSSRVPLSLQLRAWEMLKIPHLLRQYKLDHCYFSPDVHPLILPLSKATKSIHMVLHDTFLFTEPLYTKSLTRRVYNMFLARTVRNTAINLWTVSQESRNHILRSIAPKREIHMLSNGIDHLQRLDPTPWEDVQRRFAIQKPYILYNGGYDERKNVPALLRVFHHLRSEIPEIQLVLCGNSHFATKLYEDTTQLSTLEGVIHTGFIDRPDLRSLLQHADIVTSPSRAEGFNIPIGEALREAKTVIASDIPIHQEVWGEYALLTDFSHMEETVDLFKDVLSGRKKSPFLPPDVIKNLSWECQAGKISSFFVY